MAKNSNLLVQQARRALENMKFEVAQDLGIQIPVDGYMGNMATRDAGAIGGHITRRLVQHAESILFNQNAGLEYMTRGDGDSRGGGVSGADLAKIADAMRGSGGRR